VKLFSRDRPRDEAPDATGGDLKEEAIAGDRGIPSINRARSVQSRVSGVLAITLMSALGLGLLTWYYARALSRPGHVQHAAQAAAKNRAQGDMPLPSLGPIESPFLRKASTAVSPQTTDPTVAERILGPAPALPAAAATPGIVAPGAPPPAGVAPVKSAGELAFERRLAGPAFARSATEDARSSPNLSSAQSLDAAGFSAAHLRAGEEAGDSASAMNTLLRPTVTPAVAASILPTRRFLLSKGAFIDCTLETAIDSTLPGMTTCITATDTFSADGTIVLLERGTKLVGETRGQVQQGAARLIVLWTEARTPTGVVVPLSSPGTDELGRSGLPGEVNRHFWDRFGAAILLTVINGAVQGAVNSRNSGGSVVVSPSTSTDVMTEVLRSTVNIPPTVTKNQGDRIQVFVARDVDFRPVYKLRVANTAAPAGTTP
jgi:type IV secretion system protein VirB10